MRRLLLIALLGFLPFITSAETLRVAVKAAPPFAIVDDDGNWSGISAELWTQIAAELPAEFTYTRVDTVAEQVEGLAAGRYDIAVGALTMTAGREARIDFSHPYHSSGLGIATEVQAGGWWAAIKQLVSVEFMQAVGILGLLLLLVGFVIWLLERKRNPQFGGNNIARGLGDGFWWSAVTMTTVGYGDKAPITTGGRAIATVWMFASVITISGFTAAIASAFTVNQLVSTVENVDDLRKARVATVTAASAGEVLDGLRIDHDTLGSAATGIDKLAAGELDAFVHDAPLLKYLIRERDLQQLQVLPQSVAMQQYAFGLRTDLPQAESINRRLLAIVQQPGWDARVAKYIGE